jgi:hypothetical protein
MKRFIIAVVCLSFMFTTGCVYKGPRPAVDLEVQVHPETNKVSGNVIISYRPDF